MSKIEEIFLPIKGYEDYYEISNLGRVRSLDRIVPERRWGQRFRKGAINKPRLHKGYYTVGLTKYNKTTWYKIHRLIAIAFIPNPKNKKTVNHKNCIKSDNRIENLEWLTTRENTQHAQRNGRMSRIGIDNGTMKLSADQVIKIYRTVDAQWRIAKKYGITQGAVSLIKTGKTWNHITNHKKP